MSWIIFVWDISEYVYILLEIWLLHIKPQFKKLILIARQFYKLMIIKNNNFPSIKSDSSKVFDENSQLRMLVFFI